MLLSFPLETKLTNYPTHKNYPHRQRHIVIILYTHQCSPSLYSHFAITMFPTTAKEIKLALLTLWQKSVLKWLLRKKMHSSLSLTVDDSSHSPWYVSCEAVLSRNCSARSAVNRLPYNRHVTWWRTLQAFIGIFCMITQLAETERALIMSTNMQLCTIIWYAMSANPGIWAQRWLKSASSPPKNHIPSVHTKRQKTKDDFLRYKLFRINGEKTYSNVSNKLTVLKDSVDIPISPHTMF